MLNSVNWLYDLKQDVQYALRMLRKSPSFTAVAVLTLALGIGATTAIFGVVSAVLLRPLPFPHPERLVQLGEELKGTEPNGYVTEAQFTFCRDHGTVVFDSAAGFRGGSLLELRKGDRVHWVKSLYVTEDFFRVIGVNPARGRGFRPEEMPIGAPLVVVLSDAFWRSALGADPNVVGAELKLNENTYTVIGVLPRGFMFVEQPTDVYVPLQLSDAAMDRGINTRMIARLKPTITITQAQTEMNIVFQQFPGKNSRVFVGDYQRWLAGDFRASLIVVFGSTGLLLLLACLNVASLMLARSSSRRREFFIRVAIGARPGRLLRQFLTESLLLVLAGAIAGLLAARWVLAALLSSIPFNFSWAGSIGIDKRVLIFTLGTLFLTTIGFGFASYWQTMRGDRCIATNEGKQAQMCASHGRMRNILVSGEIALSFTLLVGAALLGESLHRLYQQKLGFDPENIITMTTPVPRVKTLTSKMVWSLEERMLDRMRRLPGVRSAAAVTVAPLTGQANIPTQVFGINDEQHSFGGTEIRAISDGYFETMRIPILRGRGILQTDSATSPDVALVNETLARRWWNNVNPIGQRIVIGSYKGRLFLDPGDPPREVVGVVGDVKGMLLTRPAPPMVYIPAAQNATPFDRSTAWVVRTVAGVDIAPALREAIAEVNPDQHTTEIRSMRDVIAASIDEQTFDSLLVSVFAGVALALAAVGIYGVLSLFVAQRTHEIGIRVALGAEPRHVLRLVVAQGLILAVAGTTMGTLIALGLSRFLTSILYQIKPTSYLPYVVAAIVSTGVAMLASYVPARRAIAVEPAVALRHQ